MSDVLLVGAGPMARAYHEVLTTLSVPTTVVGRGEASADAFADERGVRPTTGGLEQALDQLDDCPATAIVAVPVRALAQTVRHLADAGAERVLVEKPGGLTFEEIAELADDVAARPTVDVRVGYNRRFYGSTIQALQMIEEDGGASSLRYEFTELTHRVEQVVTDEALRASWFLANSSHVVDLACHLAGEPSEWRAFVRGGELAWHPVDRFAGAGITTRGACFSYGADWTAPGRWGIEVMTRHRRLVLQPLEELRVQRSGSFETEVLPAPDVDRRFKPGLHAQTRAFLDGDECVASLAEHAERVERVFRPMIAGS